MDQAPEQSQELSTREQIRGFLSAQDAPEEPKEQEVSAEPPQEAAEPEAPEPEAQEAEPDPTADWVELEMEGERLQVPPKWREAFQKNADYTQKTQAIAEERRFIAQQKQMVEMQAQTLQQLQPLYGMAAQLESQLQAFHGKDASYWENLRQNDPLTYSTQRADYAALMQQRNEIVQQIGQGQNYLMQQRQAALQQAVQAATPIIRKAIPDWGLEKDAALTKYALNQGATADALVGLAAQPWAVIALEKARKYDELQATKAQLPKKVQNLSPVAKPGAKPTALAAGDASYRKNMEAFQKSKGKDKNALRALLKAKLGG